MARILGCDPASSFGWVILEDGRYMAGGQRAFKHATPAALRKGAHRGDKWGHFQNWLKDTINHGEFDIIAYERVRRNASTLAAHAYGFFRYSIEAAACLAATQDHPNGVPIYPMDVGSWKKLITTSGDASKAKAAAHISLVFPNVVFEGEDHSDALSIAYSAHLMQQAGTLESVWESNGGKKKKKAKPDAPSDE